MSLLACGADRAVCVESSGPVFSDGKLLLVRDNEPQRWADVEYPVVHAAEFAGGAGSVPEGEQPTATRWLQIWVDHFDAIVRAQAERELGATLQAPHPKALLIADASGVASVPLVPVLFQEPDAEGYIGLPLSAAGAPLILVGAFPSVPRPGTWPSAPELGKYIQLLGGVGNVAEEDGRLYFPCDETSAPNQGMAVSAVAPFVRVAAKMAKTLSASAMRGTLAHELAHIYRANGTLGLASPRYWFDRGAGGRWEPPIGAQRELERAYLAAEGGSAEGVAPALLDGARTNQIGLMTFELQADRVAAHLLVQGGATRDEIVEGMLATQEAFESGGARYDDGPRAEVCRELAASGFRDQDGQPLFMRIFGSAAGEAHSAHPGFCYRIYDTYQQLQENPATPGPLPELDVDWDQERAKL